MKILGVKWTSVNYCNKTWFLRQLAASILCNLATLIIGNCTTWLEPYASELMSSNGKTPIDSNTYGWITSIMEIADAAMCFPAGILTDRYGRKRVLLLIAPLCLLSWVLVAVSNNTPTLYIVRLIQGSAEAILYTVAPVYIAEMSSASIRGAMAANISFFLQLGSLYTYVISSYFDFQTFTYLSMMLPIIFFFTFIFMPESPYYYLMKNNKNEARKALSWLRASKSVEEELTSIEEAVEFDMSRKGGFKDLFATKTDRRAFLIVQITTTSATFGGMLTIVEYAKETFEKAPLLWVTADQLSVIMGITMCISSFISIFLSDTVGRRKLLIFSSIGVALANLTICLFYYLYEIQELNVGPYVWIMYIGLISLCVLSNLGTLQLCLAIQAEFFPSHTRGIGGGVTGVISSLQYFVSLKIYIPIIETVGVYMNFVIFFLINVLSLILIIKYVSESAGKTLDEINKDIGIATEIEGDNL